jgi:hypothetical protein
MQVVLRDLTRGGGTKLPTGGASKRAGGTCPPPPVYMLKEALFIVNLTDEHAYSVQGSLFEFK